MVGVTVDTRYGRKYSCELQITASELIYNHRSFPTKEIEYIQLDPEDESRLNVKFMRRERQKAFFFISSDACEEAAANIIKVCEAAQKPGAHPIEKVSFRVQHTSLTEKEDMDVSVHGASTSQASIKAAISMDSSQHDQSSTHVAAATAATSADTSVPPSVPGSIPDTEALTGALLHPDMADVASHFDEEDFQHTAELTSPDGLASPASESDMLHLDGSRGAPPREHMLQNHPQGQIPGAIPAKLLQKTGTRAGSRAATRSEVAAARSEAAASRGEAIPTLSRDPSYHHSPIRNMFRNKSHTFVFQRKKSASAAGSRPSSPGRRSRMASRSSAGQDPHKSGTRGSTEEAAMAATLPSPSARSMVGFVAAPRARGGGGSGGGDDDDEPITAAGICLRDHPLEIFLFCCLMPLTFAFYWLSDAGRDMLNRRGDWLSARCTVHNPVTLVAEAFHPGHRRSDEDEGTVFVLERGWNVTVVAAPTRHARAVATRLVATRLGGGASVPLAVGKQTPEAAATAAKRETYSDTWTATAVMELEPTEDSECEGHIGEDLPFLRERCPDSGNWAPHIPNNASLPCYAHHAFDGAVFFDVAEPMSFYADLTVGSLCVLVSAVSLLSVVRAQRRVFRTRGKPPNAPSLGLDGHVRVGGAPRAARGAGAELV